MAGINFTAPGQTITGAPVISPDVAQQLAAAQALQQAGSSTAPIYNAGGVGWAEGLARLANGLLGGYVKGQANQEQKADQKSVAATLAQAAKAGQGWVSPDTFQGNNGQTIKAGTVAPGTGGPSAVAATLAENPLTAAEGQNIALDQAQHVQDLSEATANQQRVFGQQDKSQAAALASAQGIAARAQEGENQRQTQLLGKPVAVAPGSTLVNPGTGKPIYTSDPFGAAGGSGGVPGGAPGGAPTAPLTGEAYLATLPPAIASQVKAMSEGRQAPITGFALKSPYGQNMMAAVAQYDPSYDMTQFSARQAAQKGFVAGGKDAQFIDSTNSLAGHLATLKSLGAALQNGNIPLFNQIGNAWAQQTGEAAPTNFQTAKNIVGGEIVKAIVGAGGGEGDRAKAQAAIDGANSPAQLNGAVDTAMGIFHTQVQARAQKFQAEHLGTRSDFAAKLTPDAQQVFGFTQGSTAPIPATGATAAPAAPPTQRVPQEGDTATNPDTKQSLIFKGGQWQPLQ